MGKGKNGESLTQIMKCDCNHKQQDEWYGKGNRVHNVSKGKGGVYTGVTCTVCSERKAYKGCPPKGSCGSLAAKMRGSGTVQGKDQTPNWLPKTNMVWKLWNEKA